MVFAAPPLLSPRHTLSPYTTLFRSQRPHRSPLRRAHSSRDGRPTSRLHDQNSVVREDSTLLLTRCRAYESSSNLAGERLERGDMGMVEIRRCTAGASPRSPLSPYLL